MFLLLSISRSDKWSFLRVRGGVSIDELRTPVFEKFSPRTRRCFLPHAVKGWLNKVFSAYAEVFLLSKTESYGVPGFLRVRGGVSR